VVCSGQFLTIEKIIPGGLGLAHLADGLVVMVPRVLPGEKITAEIGKKRRGYASAALLELLEPSPFRVEPPCRFYDECGGCDFQHISYQHQLEIKNSLLQEQLNRVLTGDDGTPGPEFVSIAGSADTFHYRQRIRVQVDRGKMGFYQHGSHQIVEVSECLLAAPLLNTVLQDLRESSQMTVLLRNCQSVELQLSPQDNSVIVLVNFLRKPRPKDILAAKAVAKSIVSIKAIFLNTKKWGDVGPFLPENSRAEGSPALLNCTLKVNSNTLPISLEAGGFCQVNSKQNDKLIEQMMAWSKIGSKDKILDLFCGMGNFSIPAAKLTGSVVGTDLQRSAIRSARRNALQNRLENCFFSQKSALQSAKELADDQASFDLVIIDPPRQGCREVLPYLTKIAKSKIIYISCDPATLARDLADLTRNGFKISHIQGIDMFPQTHHIETIVLLES
jgi:23S rRNA (uracil1939-C5)-methyltransferase